MSLNFDLRNVSESVKAVTATHDDPGAGVKAGDRIQNPVTTALIWSTMSVGIGEITQENAEEFFARLQMTEKLFRPRLQSQAGPQPLTLKDVTDHIGLKTNVFPKEKQATWLKRMFDAHMRENVLPHKRLSAQSENGPAPTNE